MTLPNCEPIISKNISPQTVKPPFDILLVFTGGKHSGDDGQNRQQFDIFHRADYLILIRNTKLHQKIFLWRGK